MYLDDIIILGTNFSDCLQILRKVFSRFSTHNLKMKPRKCKFFKTKVEFLGKVISEEGVGIAPDKIEAVKKLAKTSHG